MPLFFRPLFWAALALTLAACSPTYNWRELRDDAIPLKALIPCKPDRAQREVPLVGQNVILHMHSCDAGGQTFAIAWLELPADADGSAVLAGWRQATLATLRLGAQSVGDPALVWPARVPGAESVQGLGASGQRPDGAPVQVQAAYFVHGRRAYQAAVYGPTIPPEAAANFFEALRLP